jgi:pimeloyl-ACP methyl ester carboxylesterase
MHVFYLHGFASSAGSSKGRFFAERLVRHGLVLERPDFNGPDFATLTVSRMIRQAEAAIASLPRGPVAVIGSSLGGLVAWHLASRAEARGEPLGRLVLLAPAFDFGQRDLRHETDDGLRHWRERGWWECDHHAYGERLRVHYDLYEDAGRLIASEVRVSVPTLVFQGRRDEVVDPAMVERFVAGRPNVTLHLVDDDHQLLKSLGILWAETEQFLGLTSDG